MGTQWTNPVAPGVAIKASDIQELINAINTNRANASPPLPPYPWTDPTVSAGTRIKAVHFTEMRGATQDLWNTKNMGNIPNWSSGVAVAPGNRIFASNTTDLRLWVNTYEDFNSVSGPKRGIHLNSGGPDLRECDRDFLNQQFLTVTPRRSGMVVALSPQMGLTMIAYLKSIQSTSEIFVRYMPTSRPVFPSNSLVDPSYSYDAWPNAPQKSGDDVANEIMAKVNDWRGQGLVAFRIITGNEPDLEWDTSGNSRWKTKMWQDIDHYYRDIYQALQNQACPVEVYPPPVDIYAAVGVKEYLNNGTAI